MQNLCVRAIFLMPEVVHDGGDESQKCNLHQERIHMNDAMSRNLNLNQLPESIEVMSSGTCWVSSMLLLPHQHDRPKLRAKNKQDAACVVKHRGSAAHTHIDVIEVPQSLITHVLESRRTC